MLPSANDMYYKVHSVNNSGSSKCKGLRNICVVCFHYGLGLQTIATHYDLTIIVTECGKPKINMLRNARYMQYLVFKACQSNVRLVCEAAIAMCVQAIASQGATRHNCVGVQPTVYREPGCR